MLLKLLSTDYGSTIFEDVTFPFLSRRWSRPILALDRGRAVLGDSNVGGHMRFAALAVCVALLSSDASAHFEGRPLQPCDNRPPATALKPITVPVSIMTVPGADMFDKCRKQPKDLVIYGCTFLPAPGRPALILLNADQNEQERACTLIYEKAHLPPNNWLDTIMEARAPDAKP